MRKYSPRILIVLFIVFLVAKLLGSDIPWLIVFLPLALPLILLLVAALAIYLIDSLLFSMKRKRITTKHAKQKQDLKDAEEANPCKNC